MRYKSSKQYFEARNSIHCPEYDDNYKIFNVRKYFYKINIINNIISCFICRNVVILKYYHFFVKINLF